MAIGASRSSRIVDGLGNFLARGQGLSAELSGRNFVPPFEVPIEIREVIEARFKSNFRNGFVGKKKQPTTLGQADFREIVAKGQPNVPTEEALKCGDAEVGDIGNFG
jgi:hypothetical protein